MNYNKATLYAVTGSILMLPGWHGYFYWNYISQELNFRDGDYYLNSNEFNDIKSRNDWYCI